MKMTKSFSLDQSAEIIRNILRSPTLLVEPEVEILESIVKILKNDNQRECRLVACFSKFHNLKYVRDRLQSSFQFSVHDRPILVWGGPEHLSAFLPITFRSIWFLDRTSDRFKLVQQCASLLGKDTTLILAAASEKENNQLIDILSPATSNPVVVGTESWVAFRAVTTEDVLEFELSDQDWDRLSSIVKNYYNTAASGDAPPSPNSIVDETRLIWAHLRGKSVLKRKPSAWPHITTSIPQLPRNLPSGKPWPRISVVIPTFRGGKYLEETILSIIRQEYPDFELIIIDGGSDDETCAVVQKYKHRIAYFVSEPDAGQASAINKGMRVATGDILTWINSDDMFAPGAFAAAAMAFYTSKADLVAGICEIYRDGEKVREHLTACENGKLPFEAILDLDGGWNAGQFFYQPEVMFTREIWKRAGERVREDLFFSMDYELWLRFAFSGATIHVIGRPMAHFRVHKDQKTSDVSGFKSELVRVRAEFIASKQLKNLPSRPYGNSDRRLRFCFISDLGWGYGAGIAHKRLAEAISLSGHRVDALQLSSDPDRKIGSGGIADALFDSVNELQPDIVLFGNIHGTNANPAAFIRIFQNWPTLIVVHDFWWLTGRCAYTDDCKKYLTGCDASCPTPDEYPRLNPELIRDAWTAKRTLLNSEFAPTFLANSNSCREFVRQVLGPKIAVDQITLGLDTQVFAPSQQIATREALALPRDKFIVLMSSSSLDDKRKGGDQLSAILQRIPIPDLAFVFIGYFDKFAVPATCEIISLGYIDDPSKLAMAYAAADVFVGPSREETFGQVFIEAASCGTPSVAHNVTGVRDAVRDGVTGLLTRSYTASELEALILRLYRGRRERAELGQWGRIFVENEHSLRLSYHSLFVALRRLGLLDRIGVRSNITFNSRKADIVAMEEVADKFCKWITGPGVADAEGPFPESGYPNRFHWLTGPESEIFLLSDNDAEATVIFEYQSGLFEDIGAELFLNGSNVSQVRIANTPFGETAVIHFTGQLRQGKNHIRLCFDRWRTATADEPRQLTIALIRVAKLSPLSRSSQ